MDLGNLLPFLLCDQCQTTHGFSLRAESYSSLTFPRRLTSPANEKTSESIHVIATKNLVTIMPDITPA